MSWWPTSWAGVWPAAAAAAGETLVRRRRRVRLPHPVGAGAQEIRLALGVGRRRGPARGPGDPAGDGEVDTAFPRLGANPQVEVGLALGGDGGARDDDPEPAGEPGQRRDLGHGQRPAFLAAGGAVKRHQPRLGLDQPAVGIDPAAHGVPGAHEASLATAAR